MFFVQFTVIYDNLLKIITKLSVWTPNHPNLLGNNTKNIVSVTEGASDPLLLACVPSLNIKVSHCLTWHKYIL